MSVTVNYTSTGQPIPATNGIIGVPLPEANALLGVNQADTAYQGYTLIAGVGTEIVYSDDARTITFNSTGGGGGGTTTVSAGTGISVSHVGDNYQVSSTVVAPTVSAGTNVSVSHTGNDYAISASGVQTITAGTNVTVSRVGDAVTINASGGGGGITASSADTLSNKTISTIDNTILLNGWHLSGSAPSVTVYAAAGTGRSASVSGSAFSFQLTLNTGTGVVADDQLLGFSYSESSPNGFVVTLTPANKSAAELSGTSSVYATGINGTSWRIYGSTSPLADSTTYKWNVHVYG